MMDAMSSPLPSDPHQPYQPPYVEGPQFTLGDAMPPAEPPKRRRKLPVVLAAVGAVLVVVVAGILVAAARSDKGIPLIAEKPPFEAAQTTCDPLNSGTQITDNGKTLLVDMKGEEDVNGADVTVVACLLRELKVPSAVSAHMDDTRALDGRQQDTWEGFSASWSYHPDDGLDLIIRAV